MVTLYSHQIPQNRAWSPVILGGQSLQFGLVQAVPIYSQRRTRLLAFDVPVCSQLRTRLLAIGLYKSLISLSNSEPESKNLKKNLNLELGIILELWIILEQIMITDRPHWPIRHHRLCTTICRDVEIAPRTKCSSRSAGLTRVLRGRRGSYQPSQPTKVGESRWRARSVAAKSPE